MGVGVAPEQLHLRVRPQADPRLLDAAVQALDPVLTPV